MREVLTVTKIDEDYVYLKPLADEATCSSCSISGACSLKGSKRELRVRRSEVDLLLGPGDRVLVDLKYNQAVMSFIVYGLPLSGFLVGITFGYLLRLSDLFSLLLGLGGLIFGFTVARRIDKRYSVRIIEKLPYTTVRSTYNVDT
ncbi:SoxR reducing system RseC family protein [Fervidobacterium thailandense]|uniref:Fis family transcriptional regulator n=1 Tax=Fervidobacterium thailandense TaxID=1008305 RepID=A0A1E3G4R7_9BACT|nr:SoxR reducing system RseC family protein [Fervidobacterium thailandense]ODN31265.1 hypothetical protein A4H02_00325 [Fervidobacterium thailandense]